MSEVLHFPDEPAPVVNVPLEQALLGAMLVNDDTVALVGDLVTAEDFAEPVHGRIYEQICKKAAKGERANPVTLKAAFEADDALADIGGAQYLARLAVSAVTITGAPDYAKGIRDLSLRRQLIWTAGDAMRAARDLQATATADDAINALQEELYDLGARTEGGDLPPLSEVADAAIRRIEDRMRDPGKLYGLTTGLKVVDVALGGLQATHLIVLAGRPGMGKSALAGLLARAAAASGVGVLLHSLEMSAEENLTRLATDLASGEGEKSIEYKDALKGNLNGGQFKRLTAGYAKASALPLVIDDRGGLSLTQVRAQVHRTRQKMRRSGQELKLVIIDHLQLMAKSARLNTTDALGEISSGLKALAKELDVAIVLLSQLSRAVEQRDDKRPQLSDLRGSGDIEQDADIVMFIYRDEYYAAREKPPHNNEDKLNAWRMRMVESADKAEILIEKNRHGATARLEIYCDIGANVFRDPGWRTEQDAANRAFDLEEEAQ